jgi:molybdate transport system substrate-binding protein
MVGVQWSRADDWARLMRGKTPFKNGLLVSGLLLSGAWSLANAVELSVLSAGAIEPGMRPAVVAFEKESGHQIKLIFNTAPQLRKRIADGEAWDVVLAPPAAIDEFARAGKTQASGVSVGRVGLGVAVRPGAPVPDLTSVASLKRAITQADSLVFNRASTGLYLETWLKKQGLYDQVQVRSTRYPDGASVLEHVLKGQGTEIGFGAITEILLYRDKGLHFVGPLPAEIQNYTAYTATVMAGTPQPAAAHAFVSYLGSARGRAIFNAAGIEP